ncbi:MAG: organic solvent tolerance protein [Caulobacter sp.]|nr:organic solvent tolerance protein [Caulobacter sp.]
MRLDSTDTRSNRARLLAGATALVFTALALPAFADEDQAIATALPAMAAAPQPATPLADDGLGTGGYYLEADTVIQDDKAGTIVAEGQVQVRNQGRTLRAEKVVYNRTTGVVVATGSVVIVERDGTTAFADEIVLDDQLRAGVAKGFSARLQDNIKIAGDTLVRRDDNTAELNKGIYTPCELCAEDKTRDPTWSIHADKVVQDGENHLIYYENAVIEMFGIPVFYTPILWHADPNADRMSGLLPPTIVASQRRGLSYEQPYLQVLGPSSDLTISPQINTKVNPFLNLDYRQRFYSGEIEARFGYTYEKDLDSNGSKIGDLTSRSYVLANGAFDIDKNWKWGFAAERASDDLIFDKYDISDVSRQRGLVSSDNRRLTSQLFATRQDNLSWFSVNAISVQGLRPTDNDRTFPTIAPLIEGRFELPMPVLGGRFRMQGSAVVLTREQSQFVAGQPGADSRRATFQADWRTNFTMGSGLRVSPFLEARGDYYSVADYPAAGDDASFGRALGVVGVDLTYPLFRRDGDRTIVLEPIAQIALSPDSDLDSRIPNEDSVVLEFDETNLFRANKSPGFDLYEGGLRANLGARATVSFDDGRSFSLLVGRSFRDSDDTTLPARSGLQRKASDWIVAGDAKPFQHLTLYGRARFDSETLDLRRVEIGANATFERASGYVRYLHDNQDITGVERQDIDFAADVMVTKTFGVTTAGIWDIENDIWRRQELGAFYRDDCLDLAVVWIHEETFNRSLGPSDAVVLRLTLATLGDKGYRR